MSNNDNNFSSKRVLKNTVFLYFRQMLLLGVSLYTVRVVLNALGENDYGLYNVVGGIVIMFSFINSGMVQASQRFLSYEMGVENGFRLDKIFSSINTIHWIIAIGSIVLLETIGLWFVNTQLKLPEGRDYAANIVYQFSIFSFVFGVIGVPYNAELIAHEKMNVYAYTSIGEAIFKLLICYVVMMTSYDKLMVYGLLLMLVAALNTFVLYIYCRKRFVECRTLFSWDNVLIRKIFSFASWSFLGNLGFSFKKQGVNLLINIFFGTAVNAARGIAYSVSSIVSQFANNFMMAMTPQITKQYASGNIKEMITLTCRGCRFSFYLLYLIGFPAIIFAPIVLKYWLVDVPQYTIIFLRLAIVLLMLDGLAIPIGKAIDSTGNNKLFQITIALIMLSDIPVSYLLLKFGLPPYTVMYVGIASSTVAVFARLIILRKYIKEFKLMDFLRTVIMPSVRVVLFSCLAVAPLIFCFEMDDLFGLFVTVFSIIATMIGVYFLGLDIREKDFIMSKIIRKKKYAH